MEPLKGFQKKYIRGIAHNVKPTVFVGQKGLTEPLIATTEEQLNAHELIKVKFIDFKEKDSKNEIAEELETLTKSNLCGIIGHMAILYRPHKNPGKREIVIPKPKKGL